MKIENILFDLFEDVKDIGTYRFLLSSWYGENPTDEQKSEVEDLVNKYTQLKGQNRLRPDLPNIVTFLARFRGFPTENLTQPKKYTQQQMKFLVGEYFGTNEPERITDDIPEVLKGKNLRPTDEIIEASKNLWFGNLYKIVDEGDFRVYKIPDQKAAVNFGYYEGYTLNNEIFRSLGGRYIQWCVTNWLIDNNFYTTYRPKRTFYFVIDETRSPEKTTNPQEAQYYLSAVQYSTDSETSYRITSILNDGNDPVISITDLVKIYPKLGAHTEKLQFMDYTVSELSDQTDEISLITENNPNSDYYFPAVSTELKRKYIVDKKRPLRTSLSWRSINEQLKKSYIDLTQLPQVNERFSAELFEEIKKSKQEVKSLDARLTKIGFKNGVNQLEYNVLKNKFKVHRASSSNPSLVILKTHSAPFKYGLYDLSKMSWVTKDGITYGGSSSDMSYNPPKPSFLINKVNKNEKFFVETFNKSSEPSRDSFVSIYPISKDAGKSDIMSYDSFLKLKDSYNLADDTVDIKPELKKYSDIKEIKKGI